MKITLNASIKEHREIAELFKNQPCEFKRSITSNTMGGAFVSVLDSPHYPKFVVYRLGDVTTKESITIDLDQAKMDLRMAIGTGIKFVAEYYVKQSRCVNYGEITAIDCNNQVEMEFEWIYPTKIKLCPDYLKSVGVEVEL